MGVRPNFCLNDIKNVGCILYIIDVPCMPIYRWSDIIKVHIRSHNKSGGGGGVSSIFVIIMRPLMGGNRSGADKDNIRWIYALSCYCFWLLNTRPHCTHFIGKFCINCLQNKRDIWIPPQQLCAFAPLINFCGYDIYRRRNY